MTPCFVLVFRMARFTVAMTFNCLQAYIPLFDDLHEAEGSDTVKTAKR